MKTVFQKLNRQKLAIAISSVLSISASVALSAAEESKIKISLKSQQADKALFTLAELSGTQIVFDNQAQKGVQLKEVNGEYTLSSALDLLLKDTGLVYEYMSEDMVMIRADAPSESGKPEEVEELVVTGSRLRGVSPTAPVVILTMDDIKSQGISSVEGIVRSLPQNTASLTPTSAIDNSGSVGSLGTASANLRGFGSSATLVLVNGRRRAGSPQIGSSSVVNLNTIPFNAIERVEVLLDGASSVYGSDAVAGVINFILRKGYDAEEMTTVRYEDSANGGNSYTLEQTFGTAWNSGSLTAHLRYQETDPVSASKAGFTSRDLRSRGGGDYRRDVGSPGILLEEDPEFYWIYNQVGALGRGRDASVPITDLNEFQPGNIVLSDNPDRLLSDKRDSISVSISVDQELFDGVTGFMEATYSKNKSLAETTVPSGTFTVPTTNAFNDTGSPILIGYSFEGEVAAGMLPLSANKTEAKNISIAVGFDAELPFKNWRANGYVNYTREDGYTDSFIGLQDELVDAALADSNPETALNLFGTGSQQNPQTLISIFGSPTHEWTRPNTENGETKQFSLTANGDLFKVPAGDVRAVLGVDYRTDSRTYKGYFATTLHVTAPERDVLAVMSELNVPVIGGSNSLPGVESFDIRLAARWEEYSISGPFNADPLDPSIGTESVEKTFTNTSPTVGISWFVTQQFKIRANRGESFTAPQLATLFGAPTQYYVGSKAQFAARGIYLDPVTGNELPDADFLLVGNPELDPETSDTLSYGFDWTPDGVLNGLSVSATYSEIETANAIRDTFYLEFYDPDAYFAEVPVRDPDTNEILLYRSTSLNFSSSKVESIDLNISYDFETDLGDFRYGFAGTHNKSRATQITSTLPSEELVGKLEGPDRNKLRTWLTWKGGSYGATFNVNYSSSYKADADSEDRSGITDNVEGWTSYDLTGFYEVDGGWRFSGGARNLTNQKFPFIDNRTPLDPRRVDINGRLIYLEVSKTFDLI